MKFMYTGYCTNGGFSPKVPGKKFINAASKEKKEQFKKRLKR
jgi:hypothetical protein